MTKIILLLLSILIIILIFYFFNKILDKDIENYGVYCGRYNLDKGTAQQYCLGDTECTWNNYTTQDGTLTGWCTQNPQPPIPTSS
jgi:hypothetical protein